MQQIPDRVVAHSLQAPELSAARGTESPARVELPEPVIQLWKHQLDALAKWDGRKYFALFMEPGCGKTATMINALRAIYLRLGYVSRTLILAPQIVLENWKRELSLHTAGRADKYVQVLDGKMSNRAYQIYESDKRIFITNYEALLSKEFVQAVKSRGMSCLVADESQRMKASNGKQSKALRELADNIEYCFILSGTPVLKSPMDLWAQMRILSPDILGENFFTFRARWCVDKNAGMPRSRYFPKWELRKDRQAQFLEVIDQHSFRITKAEALTLPPLVRKPVYLEMEPKQARHYREMEKEFVTYLTETDRCVTTTAVAKALRLLQICAGFLPITQGEERLEFIGSPIYEALKHDLEDIAGEHKVIVWSHFTATYSKIAEIADSLGLGFVTLTGETPKKERPEVIRAFNEDKSVRVLIGNQGAGGVGVNLQAASYQIYLTKDFSLEKDLQSEARAHRAGSEVHERITRIDYVLKGTIQEAIEESLCNKTQTSELVMKWRRNPTSLRSGA